MTAAWFPVNAWRAGAGVIVWAVHFLAIYGFTALACERGFDRVEWLGTGVITWWVLGATAISLTLILLVMRPLWRPARREFVDWLGAAVGGLALIGVLYEAIPVLMVVPCA